MNPIMRGSRDQRHPKDCRIETADGGAAFRPCLGMSSTAK